MELETDLDKLRFPIGPWARPEEPMQPAQISAWIDEMADLPGLLRAAVDGLIDRQLDTPYRPGGWTIRQVVHHLPDSHMNGYVRFRLAATEDTPTIRTYQEALWAELEDAKAAPIDVSLTLLDALLERWVRLIRGYGAADFARRLRHPEIGELSVAAYLSNYAWHGRHHVAHITDLRARMGW